MTGTRRLSKKAITIAGEPLSAVALAWLLYIGRAADAPLPASPPRRALPLIGTVAVIGTLSQVTFARVR